MTPGQKRRWVEEVVELEDASGQAFLELRTTPSASLNACRLRTTRVDDQGNLVVGPWMATTTDAVLSFVKDRMESR